MVQINHLGQLVGSEVKDFKAPAWPDFQLLRGNYVRVEPLSSAHFTTLYEAFGRDARGANWTYLPYGPFSDECEFNDWAQATCFGNDPKFYAVISQQGAAGVAAYMRIQPATGCIELGHIHLSPLLQRTREGTEALLLMIAWAFEAGYRRVEWKCDALNAPSRHAAERLGFSFEGIFRNATIYKGRNRDTAWYAAISEDWPRLKSAYESWRGHHNFDASGREVEKLSSLTHKRP